MARTHVMAFQAIRGVSIVAGSDIVPQALTTFCDAWKIPGRYGDYREMISREKLDGVSIVAPDKAHAEIAIACLERGIPVLCEKPMASTLADAERMVEAWKKAGVVAMVNYSKRNASGLQKARDLIRLGRIGRIRHLEASYLQSWLVAGDWGDWRKNPRLTWRLSTRHGSQGVLGDLGCHIYDLAAFLCGDIAEVYCRLETYDKGVPGNRLGEYVLDANDSMVATVTFASGVVGSIHSTRWAPPYVDRVFARVYGAEGTIEVDFDRSQTACFLYTVAAKEWETIAADPTPANYERFVKAIRDKRNDESDFANGLKVQKCLDASFASDRERHAVRIAG
jgi:predicted dehydrogenase